MRRIETNTTASVRTIPSRIPEEILMDEIKKEYQQGWNEAIEAAVKVAWNDDSPCDDLKCEKRSRIAKKIKELKK